MLGQAALRPEPGALDGLLLVPAGVEQGGQLVEREDDVGAEVVLDTDGHLGCEPVRRAVDVRGESDAVVIDVCKALFALGDQVVGLGPARVLHQHLAEARTQRHDLESAAVGERRTRPVHEGAQTAGFGDDVRTRLQIQVVGVGQHRLGTDRGHRLRQHRLHRRLGAHGDEGRGPDLSVRGMDDATAPATVRQFGLNGEERLRSHEDLSNQAPAGD